MSNYWARTQVQRREGVDFIPHTDIHVAHEWLQNHQAAFSARSVDNIVIVSAAQEKTFRWANMDAITVRLLLYLSQSGLGIIMVKRSW